MNSKKILIVDDVNFTLEQTMEYFECSNYRSIITAVNGEQALDIILDEMPTLVLTDLFMPIMNGDELCRIMKANPRLSKIPIVVFTSTYGEENRKRCMDAGCDAFIKKPVVHLYNFFEEIRRFLPDIKYREHRRIPISGHFACIHGQMTYSGRLINISEGGAFINTDCGLSHGEKTAFEFSIPGASRPVRGTGKVAWKSMSQSAGQVLSGIGMEFIHVDIQDRRTISDYVRSHPR